MGLRSLAMATLLGGCNWFYPLDEFRADPPAAELVVEPALESATLTRTFTSTLRVTVRRKNAYEGPVRVRLSPPTGVATTPSEGTLASGEESASFVLAPAELAPTGAAGLEVIAIPELGRPVSVSLPVRVVGYPGQVDETFAVDARVVPRQLGGWLSVHADRNDHYLGFQMGTTLRSVHRLKPNGAYDEAFRVDDAKLQACVNTVRGAVPVSQGTLVLGLGLTSDLIALALGPQGEISVCTRLGIAGPRGRIAKAGGHVLGFYAAQTSGFFRLSETGTLDTQFGQGGLSDIGTGFAEQGLVAWEDGSGMIYGEEAKNLAIWRFRPPKETSSVALPAIRGSLVAGSVGAKPQEAFVLAVTGEAGKSLSVLRVAGLEWDPTFTMDPIELSADETLNPAFARAHDGSFYLVVGRAGVPELRRLDPAGQPDARFGKGGRSLLPVGGVQFLSVQEDGRVVGFSDSGQGVRVWP